jgi:hypothetical protein
MTLEVSESMPSIVRSLEKYWDLNDLLERVAEGVGNFATLDQSLRSAFATGRKKYIKYSRKLEKNALLYAAHILDPRCRGSMIKDKMPERFDEVIQSATKYFHAEWPELAKDDTSATSNTSYDKADTRSSGMSLAQWKAIQNKRLRDAEARISQPSSEHLRWFSLGPLEWSATTNNEPDFARKWWR